MIMKKLLTYLLTLSGIFLCATAQDRIFGLSRQSFALNIFKNLSTPESFMISPVSIDFALSAIFFGSSQQTFLELMQGLNYPKNYSMNLIQSNFQLMYRNLKKINGLELATKLFINDTLKPQPNYKAIVTRVLDAEISPIAFERNVEAAEKINSWVSNKTRKMITEIIDPFSLNGGVSMILVNCIYFKGTWLYTFPKANTVKGNFYVDQTKSVEVDFMNIKTSFLYGNIREHIFASVVSLPYKNSSMSMLLVLPRDKNGLQDLIRNISYIDWTKIEDSMYKTVVNVTIPKFNITYESRIEQNLKNMGMKLMFDSEKADLNRMLASYSKDMNIHVDTIIHKSVINVDEEGTVAAAVTLVMTRSIDMRFNANYPFLFMLKTAREIIFIGKYNGNN